jgi:hypothetical protein
MAAEMKINIDWSKEKMKKFRNDKKKRLEKIEKAEKGSDYTASINSKSREDTYV